MSFKLTEEMKNKIHERYAGTAKLDLDAISDLCGVEDIEDYYADVEILEACDLYYCDECGWVFSELDGYGESSDDCNVCHDCGDDLE